MSGGTFELVDGQVVQRGPDGFAEIALAGRGVAEAVVAYAGDSLVETWPVRADANGWTAVVPLPTGGPYALRAVGPGESTTIATDVSVGDIWVLAGQSNMEGWGRRTPDADYTDDRVRVLDMARRWRLAEHPLHVLADSPDPAHVPQSGQERVDTVNFLNFFQGAGIVVGPGLAFGRCYADLTGVPVGLVATAHGGTSMAQWSPALRDEGGDSLYGSMLTSVKAAGGRVAGVLWYQGESDADTGDSSGYRQRLDEFIEAVRRDIGSPDLPFVLVQVSRYANEFEDAQLAPMTAAWNDVREQQRTSVRRGATAVVAGIDLPMDDWVHLDARAHERLGRRLAGVAAGARTQPDISTITRIDDAGVYLRVDIAGVNGALRRDLPVAGFSIRRNDGSEVHTIFRAEVTGDGCAVELHLAAPPKPGQSLWYGYGLNPVCTVVDDGDMALLASGPWQLA